MCYAIIVPVLEIFFPKASSVRRLRSLLYGTLINGMGKWEDGVLSVRRINSAKALF